MSKDNRNIYLYERTRSFEERSSESNRIKKKYPKRIPIIVEGDKQVELKKNKYLVPYGMSIAMFIHHLRKSVALEADEGFFLFVEGTLPAIAGTMGALYIEYKRSDGFLYCLICKESTYG